MPSPGQEHRTPCLLTIDTESPARVPQGKAGCAGSNWLYPLVDGHPPIGWDDASRYLALPVLLVLFQYVSSAAIAPPPDPNQVSH